MVPVFRPVTNTVNLDTATNVSSSRFVLVTTSAANLNSMTLVTLNDGSANVASFVIPGGQSRIVQKQPSWTLVANNNTTQATGVARR